MNILICNNRYFPSSGPERYLFAITDLLTRHGHTVVPLAADYRQTVETPYRKYFVPPPADSDSVFYSQYKDKLTIAKRAKIAARAMYSSTARRAADRAIRELDIDLVYLLNTVNVLSPSIIDAAHKRGVPVVMRLSDFNLLCPAYAFLRDGKVCQECLGGLYHALQHRCLQGSLAVTGARVAAMTLHRSLGIYKRVGAFVAPSRYLAEQLRRHFPAGRGRIYHVPSFVDQSLLDASAAEMAQVHSAASEGDRRYVLYFGRVSADKGVDVLLHAFGRLERDVDLVIAGDDANGYRQQMEELARSLGVAQRARFPGFVAGAALAELIAGSLYVVAPSLWHDNAPMTVYESLAYGKAVIGSDMGGIAEQLEDGCGVVVPPGDADGLADAMRLLIDMPGLRTDIEQAAHHKALTQYTPERHYERLMQVFETARARRSRSEHMGEEVVSVSTSS